MSVRSPVATQPRDGLPLIETKLAPGRLSAERLVRRRLLAELDRFSSRALTLIDAPVGFGKTVLAQTWCAHTDAAVAWVSLDAGDNDPARLWTYVATSVDRVRPGLGRMALARLRTPGVPAVVAVDELINGIASYGQPLAIVLDDLHTVRNDECLSTLQHAIERLPPQATIVAATRSDPALSLGRLRAGGSLGEIRARELSFTAAEARELLVEQEGIDLDEDDVALLVERTEGWPAGLYLAALWLRETAEPKADVRAFHGDHRHVAEYLSREVLDTLDDDTRRFLLETSTLGRFTAAMCDAALGRSDSAARLKELERTNQLVVALDAHGEWYRYHHLFGELLQLELKAVDAAAPRPIHERAAAWCHEHGLIEDALDHAAEAGQALSVAAILSNEHRALLRSGQLTTVLRWGGELPDEVLLERPEIPAAMALAAGLRGGLTHERRRYLALAGRSRTERPEGWTPYHEAILGLAHLNWVDDDLGAAIELARRTVEVGRAGVEEATVPALAGLAYLLFLAGDLAEARALAHEALGQPESRARPHGLVLALVVQALVDAEELRPDAAEESARAATAAARAGGIGETASGGLARLAFASALLARGNLREAEREAVHGEELRRSAEPEAGHLHALLVLAQIRARRGRLERASADLEIVRRGLESFRDAGRLPTLADALERAISEHRVEGARVADLPSSAELGVLRLLATDLSQRAIGAELYLSLNTVKTHTRSLYRKLGVSSREAAVTRAHELGLLDDSPG
jgi:LuxR family maltose regulon positive regulatory protein